MTERKRRPDMRPAAALAAALALSGCAATHVGEDWQCPLAQGAVCASVAAADPALPETQGAERLATGTPLYEPDPVPGDARTEADQTADRACEADCGPFAWLRRLFEGIAGGPEDTGVAATADPEREASSPQVPTVPAPADAGLASAPDAASLPAPAVPSGEDLRAPEVIGRVWIAPFVDADGIYREGSYVRLVIEPARWRLR